MKFIVLSKMLRMGPYLKLQSFKLYYKYIIASTQTTNTEIFAVVAVLVFKLLSGKVFFINRKTIEIVEK